MTEPTTESQENAPNDWFMVLPVAMAFGGTGIHHGRSGWSQSAFCNQVTYEANQGGVGPAALDTFRKYIDEVTPAHCLTQTL